MSLWDYFGRNSVVYYDTKNSSPIFDSKNNTNAKWVNMALFNYEKDTIGDDTWMMTQIVDKEKLEYIISLSKESIAEVGIKGQKRLLDIRNHEKTAKDLAIQLEAL